MGVTWQISLNSSCCLECRLLYLTLFHLVLRLQYYSMRRVLCDMHNSWEIGRPSGNTGSWDKKHLNNRTYWGLCGAEPRDWLGRICLKWILSKIWNINMVLREMYWDRYTFKACDYDTTLTVYRHWWKLLDKKWQLIKTKHTYKLCPSVCPSVLNCLSTCVSVCLCPGTESSVRPCWQSCNAHGIKRFTASWVHQVTITAETVYVHNIRHLTANNQHLYGSNGRLYVVRCQLYAGVVTDTV